MNKTVSVSDPQHILIIGGGVIGAACAYYLTLAGRQVTIIERHQFGMGSSHGNCGFISPSHVPPLSRPGAISKTLKSLFDPDSAFRVKPSFSLALWRWLWQFLKRCNQHDMLTSAAARNTLLQSSSQLYRDLIEQKVLEDCEWEAKGLLFVFETEKEQDQFAPLAKLVQDEFGVDAARLDGSQLAALEPALKPTLAGAYHYRGDAHLRPDRLIGAWRKRLENMGVEIREHCELQNFLIEHGRARAVSTSQGEMAADAFLVAMGAWSPMWNHLLGCKLPIQPGKGLSITMPRPNLCPKYPMILEECHVGVTPFASGYRLGSTMEFAGYDARINPRRLALLRKGAARYLIQPACEPVEEEWFGFRPMSCDGVPIIDRSPRMQNVMIATGHSMLGVSMSPATGKLVAELLTSAEPHVDPRPYQLARFG